MTFPTGLFVDAPEQSDVSMHQLSEDSNAWPEEIIMKVKERLPSSEGLSMIVKFMKKDDEAGVATGAVTINDSTNMCYVPLVIKDFMLYPLDIFVAKNKLLPLTPDYFRGAFQNNSAFQNLEEYPNYGGMGRFDDGNLWNTIYPPSLGRYAYASNMSFPILNDIADTIDPTEFKQHLRDNPGDAARLVKAGHAELIKKIAHLQPVNMNEFRQGFDNLANKNVFMLKREAPDKYSILACADDVFSPVLHREVPFQKLHEFKSMISDCVKDTMNEVDMNGEKFLYVPVAETEEGRPYMAQGEQRRMEYADEFDTYVVKKRNGVEVEGAVIPTVIDFSMNVTGNKLFLGKTMSTIQEAISGIRVPNSSFCLRALETNMRPGLTGTLVFQKNKSKALATIPFTVVAVTIDCGCVKVTAQDLMGVGFKFRSTGADLARIVPMGGDENCYLVPDDFFFVPMEGFHEVSNSPVDFVAKTASAGIKVIHTGYGQFSIPKLQKYAAALGFSASNLTPVQAQFLLATHGLGKEAHAIIKTAEKTGIALAPVRTPKDHIEKKASLALKKFAYKLKSNLIKAASYVENTQSVDSLLSLNFINPDNVLKFIGRIPSLKHTISDLAMLLMATRLGVKEIPEQSVSSAMTRLIDVVNGLETLRATQEQTTQQQQ